MIDTPHGPARAHVHPAEGEPRGALMLGHFSGDEVVVALPGWEDAEPRIGSRGLTLGPWEGRALLRTADGLRDLCA